MGVSEAHSQNFKFGSKTHPCNKLNFIFLQASIEDIPRIWWLSMLLGLIWSTCKSYLKGLINFLIFFIKLEYNTLKQKLSTRISFINHLWITSVVVISRFTCKVLSMTLSPLSHTEEEEDIWNNKISNEKNKEKEKEKKIKGTA